MGAALTRAPENRSPPPIRETPWPAHCCVPAFLGAAVGALAQPVIADSCDTRRVLAHLTQATLPSEDVNPWGLPTSDEPDDWGVTPSKALATFPEVAAFLNARADLVFEICPFNEVPFGLYEDAVSDLIAGGAVVGISFDHAQLRSEMGLSEPESRAHHVARLTPFPEESGREPNVSSAAFGFDYDGALWVFDDSGELSGDDALVDWASLLRASRRVGGGLWVVCSGTSEDAEPGRAHQTGAPTSSC